MLPLQGPQVQSLSWETKILHIHGMAKKEKRSLELKSSTQFLFFFLMEIERAIPMYPSMVGECLD